MPNILSYILRSLAVRPPTRTKTVLAGDDVPIVDILITCCNEDLDVILDTVRAACVLNYPQNRFRVFVCDDGSSAELETSVNALRADYNNLFYTARTKGPKRDYKAGNLNHGLRFSRTHPRDSGAHLNVSSQGKHHYDERFYPVSLREQPSTSELCSIYTTSREAASGCSSRLDLPMIWSTEELMLQDSSSDAASDVTATTISDYVAGLDADMIPEPDWLRVVLPHLLNDPRIALACPPQTFYDIPVNDPLTQTMAHFAGITEVVNDALGHADCLGSGYVVRRSAIEQIGGFPVESLSEDVCCSATLLGAGWKTAFVQRPVQYGSVPESFLAHVKQRTRWVSAPIGYPFRPIQLFQYRLTVTCSSLDTSKQLFYSISVSGAFVASTLAFSRGWRDWLSTCANLSKFLLR